MIQRLRESDDVCVHSGRRARFAKNIRKQIMMVRRKLSMQKRKMEAADAKAQDTGGSAGLRCISLDLSLGFAVNNNNSPKLLQRHKNMLISSRTSMYTHFRNVSFYPIVYFVVPFGSCPMRNWVCISRERLNFHNKSPVAQPEKS